MDPRPQSPETESPREEARKLALGETLSAGRMKEAAKKMEALFNELAAQLGKPTGDNSQLRLELKKLCEEMKTRLINQETALKEIERKVNSVG
ncbi:MAG: hypothetical protein UW07_C0037G0005 [Candidatus Nomurabacteria bacterium GW2011_GWF2_43_8]|uniref:Uncharacterized protein n=3 Tax=Candidatus Nomuraibacteriota TaxID=1752729 RepID=A0A0G1FK65_9BACT|nr:MAG: hypothetical protein UV76_C0002G0040 [Candidatus Nomurabacteria bacterium GW2011_GWA2_43_15]KKT19917.1 MAG: hypothetical protein UW02_C0004G0094 [Candidatus Nomurabacteria bacterium GW2011_GWB1_43_7]KKT22388.1 MAG: hypothetical protein UW07_C0037G0005 [Candidatus Nomurabacteria bacterium GW2011_GWF2_43_8]